MKRSDMIDLLKFWINDNTYNVTKNGCHNAIDHNNLELDELANSLLNMLESSGMLPPNTMPDSLQLTERNAEFLAKVNRHFKWKEDINEVKRD